MISGWAGIGLNDEVIEMPVPEVRLYYRAGGFPLTNITQIGAPFPTREIEERQHVVMEEGVSDDGFYGWWIYFQRNDAFGAAIVEFDVKQLIPLTIEGCPHVTVDNPEEVEDVPVVAAEPDNPVISYIAEPECVGLAIAEEP